MSLIILLITLTILSCSSAGPIIKGNVPKPLPLGPFSRYVNFECFPEARVNHYGSNHYVVESEGECISKCGNKKGFKVFTYIESDKMCHCQKESSKINLNATAGSICILSGRCDDPIRAKFSNNLCQTVEWEENSCSVIDPGHKNDACLPLACEPGFSGLSGACLECKAGNSSPGGSNNPCLPCFAGSYSLDRASECITCRSGLSSPGEIGCITTCPIGAGVEDDACILCPEGTWGRGGSSSCIPCNDGLDNCDSLTGNKPLLPVDEKIQQVFKIDKNDSKEILKELELEECPALKSKSPCLSHGFSGSHRISALKKLQTPPKYSGRTSIQLNASKSTFGKQS